MLWLANYLKMMSQILILIKKNIYTVCGVLYTTAEYMDGKITSVLAVCKGRNKSYRGFKFEYINNK